MRVYRDLVKHSSIYGLGQVLSRLASVLLLPVYTHFLQPADYGTIAILDVTAGLLAILVGSGMVAAVTRYHFEAKDDEARRRVWWTGLSFIAISALAIGLPAILLRKPIAWLILGPAESRGGLYVALSVAAFSINCVGQLAESYLRIRKWSGPVVGLSMLRLALNVSLNLAFLIHFEMGVYGVLLGNACTSVIMTMLLVGTVVWNERPFAVDLALMWKLMAFGSPILVTALLSLIMHDADRYLLRLFVSMDDVGVYSLAYQIGQGVNALCLVPFSAIWSVVVYEIASQPNARAVYARVFGKFFEGLALVLLGASFFARPALAVLTPGNYAAAADLVPIVCLAYLFFSLHEHFRVPVILKKKTLNLLPAFLVAATLNVVSNMILIPRFGAAGAAWASVVTFAAFSATGLILYRRFDKYPYPFIRCVAVLAGMSATWLAWRNFATLPQATHIALATALWFAWAVALFGKLLLGKVTEPRSEAQIDGMTLQPVPVSKTPAMQTTEA